MAMYKNCTLKCPSPYASQGNFVSASQLLVGIALKKKKHFISTYTEYTQTKYSIQHSKK